ncbi:MAG TPA: Xaa-Pro dipeptidase [Steroidobacteraceae bacterium]|nr:Xaa-Pro dipeptidase [Steroidobacteraceae bacterium]
MDTTDALDALFPAHIKALTDVTGRALEAAGGQALVVGSGFVKFRYLDDQADPFVVSPHFKSWAPVLDAPGSFVIFVPGRKPVLLFHQPEDYWHKPPSMPSGAWLSAFDVRVIRHPADARGQVPAGATYLGEPFAGCEDWGFANFNPPALVNRLHWARATKTPYELACMRRAAAAGARAHRAAAEAFAAGASEYEIHLAYVEASGHTEAELPYPNIIALNEGAAILHYTDLQRSVPPARRSFLIDAGAQCRGYACDITRTHTAMRSPFADLVAGVDALEQRLCEMVRPGVAYPEIHFTAHRLVGELLVELGIITCSAEAAVATDVTSVFFPHGVGHLLGLQVHDVGGHQATEAGGGAPPPSGHPYLRLTRRLEPGTVVTIEPGVYFIDLLLDRARQDGRGSNIDWDTVADLAPCGGARIEDDVVATAEGPENLTRAAFAALGA